MSQLKESLQKLASDHPELREHLVPILKEAAFFRYDGNPIRKSRLVRIVNDVLGKVTRGIYTDQYWQGPKKAWKALDEMNLDWNITKTEYDQNMPNESKTWKFEIIYQNERGKPSKLYGHLVASGMGSVTDPLDRYDVVAYVT